MHANFDNSSTETAETKPSFKQQKNDKDSNKHIKIVETTSPSKHVSILKVGDTNRSSGKPELSSNRRE